MSTMTLANRIDGEDVAPASGAYLETENPYTGKAWGRIARSDARDVDLAVAAAKRAMREGPWAQMTPSARGRILLKIAEAAEAHADELARIEVRDNGKTLREMGPQLKRMPEWYRYFAGLADKIEGALLPEDKPGHMAYVRHEPIGVAGLITPWNSPLMLLAWKLAPALAAGCSAVVKPSEFTSASALRFAQIAEEAGLPKGVLNVVTGLGHEAGAALVAHPDVAKVAFTGGVGGGRAAARAAGEGLKPISLELGGKSPNIVFADADLEMAARGAVSGIFGSGGQSCVAGSRLLVQREVHDALVARVLELTAKIRLGDPMAPQTDIGPVATRPQYDRILECIAMGRADGATLATGGAPAADPAGGPALFVEPTIFTNVTSDMRLAQEEVFGPVLCVLPFEDEAEALRIANDTAFGLGAGIWTRDLSRAHRMAAKIEAGSVWVNTYKVTSHQAPFGGYRASGVGREGGLEAVHDYLETKTVWLNLSGEFPYGFPL